MVKKELEMKAVWTHRIITIINKANFKITKKEVLIFEILVLNSNEPTKQVLYHNLKNNHQGLKSIDKKVSIQMLLIVNL